MTLSQYIPLARPSKSLEHVGPRPQAAHNSDGAGRRDTLGKLRVTKASRKANLGSSEKGVEDGYRLYSCAEETLLREPPSEIPHLLGQSVPLHRPSNKGRHRWRMSGF